MKIASARVVALRMPLKDPWKTSFGAQPDITTVLVRLTGSGAAGWGEAAPGTWPLFCGEWASSTFTLVRELMLPRLVGADIDDVGRLTEMFADIRGNTFAKAAVETAWWSLRGAVEQYPLSHYVGGSRSAVTAGADFDLHADTDELLAKVGDAVGSGCPRVKLKVGRQTRIEQLRQVRSAFPDVPLHVDCNGVFSRDDADFLTLLDSLELAMIEQPLAPDDFLGHAEIQRRLHTPVCLDESIRSSNDLELALRLGSCRFVNVKPGRVGGFWNAAAIGQLAQRAGIGAVVGNMLESPIGAHVCLALTSCEWATYPADLFPSERFFPLQLTDNDIPRSASDGWTFDVPETPGNPAVPLDDVLSQWLVADSREMTT
ncbi:o-succinylbenzoate synthase [Jatrophihabitans lederbergiae]|uniref:o-succinylbenzoate synthase n=1 Tax=Jatrophihabitans lederbergiae TaxID=3075547 RepID=A0ABU2JAF1_9ACTN|nr:o-succinylbenzoate synthase [Jatrophihabitans sp. DSM 44399]MDT0261937.1 o-succinylbenzoate synthase [Jatrophihabitans sp. DSM 44399]